MNRKRVVLMALLGILAVCLIYAYLATPRLEKAPPEAAGPGTQSVKQQAPSGDGKVSDARIDFAYLASTPQEFTGAQRDIFRFGQRRPVKSAPAPTPPVMEEDVAQPVLRPEPVPVEVVRRSLSQFTFLGFLEKDRTKTVFLSSGGEMFLVKQGEYFGSNKEFRVEEIDDKLLKVRHAGGEGLIEVELIEKQKLSSAVSAPARSFRAAGPAAPAAAVSPEANNRVLRSLNRISRPVTQQGGQMEDQAGSEEYLQAGGDENTQADGNSWPENKREGLSETDAPGVLQEPENPVDENATEGEVNGENQ